MKEKTKKLYFTDDFSKENVEKLQAKGWVLRKASAVSSSDSIEQADEYGGDVPIHYKSKVEQITAQLAVELSPELQQVIDDTKAECEKVVAENESLKAQLKAVVLQEAYDEVLQERTQLEKVIESIKADLESASNERNALSVQNADLQTTIDGLNKTIKSLEAKLKKQSVADLPPEQAKE